MTVTSTSAWRSAFVPKRPPKPDPITTTLCRADCVAGEVMEAPGVEGASCRPLPRSFSSSGVRGAKRRARRLLTPLPGLAKNYGDRRGLNHPLLGNHGSTGLSTPALTPLKRVPVPLTSELTLASSPRAAADARRWVGDVCERLERSDLVECAELGVSELVANAILHAAAPYKVRVRGTASPPAHRGGRRLAPSAGAAHPASRATTSTCCSPSVAGCRWSPSAPSPGARR